MFAMKSESYEFIRWSLPNNLLYKQKVHVTTRDLKITHPVRLRRFRLKFNGIGRRGFNQQKRSPRLDLDW